MLNITLIFFQSQYGRQEQGEEKDAGHESADGAYGKREPERLFVSTVDEEGNHAQDSGKNGQNNRNNLVVESP